MINILGSQMSPSSINLVPARAGKVTVGLASHWPCVTDTVVYPPTGLNGQRQGDEHPRLSPFGAWHHLLYHRVEALSDDARLTSDVSLSIAYIGPKSRTERPRNTKTGTEVAHVTRDSDTNFKVKRSNVNLQRAGHIVAASRTACSRYFDY